MPIPVPNLLDVAHLPVEALPRRLRVPTLASVRGVGATPFDIRVRPPGSKSLTNRALLLAALASGESVLRGALIEADDARRMLAAIGQLGAKVEIAGNGDVRVQGVGGRWRNRAEVRLDLGNAGTATRFLAAAAMLGDPGAPGIVIDGNERMRQRPIGELVSALRGLGVQVDELGVPGFPPIRVRALMGQAGTGGGTESAARAPRTIRFGRTSSSQFISAVMLVAPWLGGGLTVEFESGQEITSEPYIAMTLALLRRIGASVKGTLPGPVHVGAGPQGQPRGFEYDVEPDASGATYFLGAAAIVPGGSCTIEGLGAGSEQGDAGFYKHLLAMGAEGVVGAESVRLRGGARLRGINADLRDIPDTAMTLAAVCCFADGPSELMGLRTLRVKETDRIAALAAELSKIGAKVGVLNRDGDEGIRIEPPGVGEARSDEVVFETYDDHRMAMALALIGLRRAGVVIDNPGCVAKTYPRFWADLCRLYGENRAKSG